MKGKLYDINAIKTSLIKMFSRTNKLNHPFEQGIIINNIYKPFYKKGATQCINHLF
jgi:hypothetical protein